jgi:hypothetical protein
MKAERLASGEPRRAELVGVVHMPECRQVDPDRLESTFMDALEMALVETRLLEVAPEGIVADDIDTRPIRSTCSKGSTGVKPAAGET